jgi:Fur family ferric uptake transcriptional regulator
MTPLRRVILEELAQLATHPTADQVYEIVRRRMPHASLGSVYRNLNVLCDSGMIRRANVADPQARFDPKTDDHYHVRCIRCGRMDDVDLAPDRRLEAAVRRASAYEITGHRLEFTGVCPQCRNAEPRGRRRAPARYGARAKS